jgi:ribonucrease Y
MENIFMELTSALGVLVVSLLVGYFIFYVILKSLPTRLNAGHQSQKSEILAEAKKHAEAIRSEALASNESKIQILREELEATLTQKQEDLKLADTDLDILEKQVGPVSARIQKLEHDVTQVEQHMAFARSSYESTQSQLEELNGKMQELLEKKSASDAKQLVKSMTDQLADARQLESQKLLKLYTEDLSNSAKRIASRFLGRSMARYAPEFPWPKMVNTVDVENQKYWDILATDANGLLKQVKELVGIEAEFMPPRHSEMPGLIKLSGGMGMEREAARLALADVLRSGTSAWPKIEEFYQRQRSTLEAQALKLGRQAALELQLDQLHVEVLKLIGQLNWRTSYRQNQYLHSFEVSMLAGLVAEELGVDPTLAKRCGLLHDIGKVLDYRIEGSHAVISGDYADRYGESKLICDTLMSHHNDLIVETPLAYVLKTADTLSGARPGARVNLEEGYQDRLSAIDDVIRAFPGITKSSIMNGAREIHIEVNNKRVKDEDLQALTTAIAKKIETDVAFPGQIKVMVSRRFESSSVA